MRKFALSFALLALAAGIGFDAAAQQAGTTAQAGTSADLSGAADTIKIGLLKVSASAPVLIVQEKGYFAKERLRAELFMAEQPPLVVQGVVAGDLAFGIAGATSAFYNLAGRGTLRIIAGNAEEAPGFGTPVELLKLGIAHIDADDRVDVTDIERQIAWYKSQGFVKSEVDPAKIIDVRYVVSLPQK